MQAWEEFLKLQEKELGLETVKIWLTPLKVVNFDACNLFLEAENAFQVHWFEEYMRKKVLRLLRNNNKKPIKVHLSVANGAKDAQKKKTKPKAAPAPPPPKLYIPYESLDPSCTFENYMPSEGNALTYRLLAAISAFNVEKNVFDKAVKVDIPGSNPLYIYGVTGSGKTHLLQAVTQGLRQQGLKAVYVRAETFTDHVVSAIRASEMSAFRQSYRNVDALIIDDVHVFSRKSATQEELFHTFNTLHGDSKQIILSANVSPSELQLIEPRLVSRFEWGIVLPLQMHTKEDLKKILNKKAEAFHYDLHPKVTLFLLETFTSNSKALIRALEALMLRTHSLPNVTVQTVKQHLGDLIAEEEKNKITPEKILTTVSSYFGIKKEDIVGKTQTREFVLPRQIAMHLCRTQLQLPFMKIGDLFGKDHSTVMSSVKSIQSSIEEDDSEVAGPWQQIHKKLRS